MSSREEKIVQFKGVCSGATDDEARRYLGRKGWDVSAAVEAAYADGWSPPPPKYDEEEVEALFKHYADMDEETWPEDSGGRKVPEIGENGLWTLAADIGCPDLETELAPVVLLMHCDAATFGRISKQEFKKGVGEVLQCHSAEEIKSKIPGFKKKLEDKAFFRDFFRYFLKYMSNNKTFLERDYAVACLGVLLPDPGTPVEERTSVHTWALSKKYLDFLKAKDEGFQFTVDDWMMTLEFAEKVEPDLSNWDELDDGCWPGIIDEFVEENR